MMTCMDESAQFTAQLEEAISARGEYVASHVTPKLKEQFRSMRSSFEAIHNVLKKMGLIKEDPYHYEERITELDIPSDKPYLESERDTELSVRLNQYQSRLEFLTDYYDFSLKT